jgi:hypothetical protein
MGKQKAPPRGRFLFTQTSHNARAHSGSAKVLRTNTPFAA